MTEKPSTHGKLDALRPTLMALPDRIVKLPYQPVDGYLQEARNLYRWSLEDRVALEAAGVDWGMVEAMPDRIEALGQAETAWLSIHFNRPEAEKRWKEAEREGYERRNDMLAVMRHAFRKDVLLLGRVRGIGEGRGDSDMIQDLNDIAVLGREHLALLEPLGLTGNDLELAAALSADLGSLLAVRKSDQTDEEALDLRNRAFAFLREAVTDVRTCGRFAFRKDPRRARRYTSFYMRGHRGGGRRTEGDPEPEV